MNEALSRLASELPRRSRAFVGGRADADALARAREEIAIVANSRRGCDSIDEPGAR